MKFSDLSVEDQALLNTKFPEALEKEAAADAEKVNDLYSTGFDKFASEMADEHDEAKKEEEKDEKKHEHLTEEHKKEAAVRGAFIARGTIDGLMKQGSERHGDEFHYLYEAISEKLGGAKIDALKASASKLKASMGAAAGKAKASMSAGAAKAKEHAGAAASKTKEHLKTHGKSYAAGGAAALAGYGAGRMHKKED